MARPVGLPSDPSKAGIWRVVTGSPVAADSTTLTDTNYPAAANATTGGAMRFWNVEALLVALESEGGAGVSVTLSPLFRDEDAADGARWRAVSGASGSVTLASGGPFEVVAVHGAHVFPRITAVTGSPTTVRLLIKPATAQMGPGIFR